MTLTNDLWRKLSTVEFDAVDASFPFTKRLARDCGWSHDFAKRVAEEYRRFAYLAMTAGHEVTPSDEVDQAWHLHLTYTRHYWGEFTEALGGPLHHGPTKGGAAENHRYTDNYAKTKASYEQAFGEAPPTDIWPASDIRFGEAPFMRRVNTARHYVFSKRDARRGVGVLGGVGALVVAGAAAAQSQGGIGEQVSTIVSQTPPEVWLVGAAGLLLFVVIGVVGSRANAKRDNSGGGYADGGSSAGSGGKSGGGKDGSGCGSDGGGSGCGGCGGCGG